MPPLPRSTRFVFLSSVLLVFIVLPGILIWKPFRQQRLDHDLIVAVKSHNTVDVKSALTSGANPDARDKNEEEVSWWQAWYQHFGRNAATEKQGDTALMLAIQDGADNIVALLIQHGAHVTLTDSEGQTALMEACVYEHQALVLQLLRAGANVNQANKNGGTALLWASSGKSPSLVNLLLEHGASIHIEVNGWTPLRHAVDNENVAMVKFLLAHHADTKFYPGDGTADNLVELTWIHEQTPAKRQIRRLLTDAGVKGRFR